MVWGDGMCFGPFFPRAGIWLMKAYRGGVVCVCLVDQHASQIPSKALSCVLALSWTWRYCVLDAWSSVCHWLLGNILSVICLFMLGNFNALKQVDDQKSDRWCLLLQARSSCLLLESSWSAVISPGPGYVVCPVAAAGRVHVKGTPQCQWQGKDPQLFLLHCHCQIPF